VAEHRGHWRVRREDERDAKFVASTTLRDPAWTNTTVLDGNLAREVGALKQRYDGDILIAGSAQLVQSLIDLDLIDEMRLMVFPVVLGKGTRLFGETSERKPLELVDSRGLENGVFLLTYRPPANGSAEAG
jgi:dihydrofolate reductase